MIRRTYLGLDVRSGELRAVALRRRGRGSALFGGRVLSLAEGVLVPSAREPNIRDLRSFVEGLHEVLGPLSGREERIALSLPESSGRVLLTEVDTPFKSKDEGVEILKWQFKGSLPFDPREVQVDYQVLEKTDTGRYRLVVALMSRKVLEQYETIFAEAGYNPSVIDFHSLHLYNYYRPRLDLGEALVLVGAEDGTLSFQYFQGQVLSFHRVREVAADPALVFREINRSLVGCREGFTAFRRAAVFVHSDWPETTSLLDAVRSAFERDVVLLDPHLERLALAPLDLPQARARGLAAAIGAAERMM